ncbi:Methyltransferase like 2 [Giardia lamblia P15]|uniref:Methyltransferase like 2 n=1 Tax=Giardia intestinalis (strain P15) TaxID=658858 RepID=E1F1Z3_GIAIA|nr:Methyltransferase like 2 [Giardia lamblia P15]
MNFSANPYERSSAEAANEWNHVYAQHKGSLYRDRHWLWAIFPEIFPLPPHYKGDLDTRTFVCHCGKVTAISSALVNEVNMHGLNLRACCCPVCEYKIVYQSTYVYTPGRPTRGEEVPFPPRTGNFWVLDIGCGTGSLAFPLLEKNSQVRLLSLDYSEEAIKVLKSRDRYSEEMIVGKICDITSLPNLSTICAQLATQFTPSPVFYYATMVFVLSALKDSNAVKTAISNVLSVLTNNGVLLIYDYAEGDYRERKFSVREQSSHNCLSMNQKNYYLGATYLRGEGTRATFFYLEALKELCSELGVVHEALVRTKEEYNRKTRERWVKKYLLIKVRKPSHG